LRTALAGLACSTALAALPSQAEQLLPRPAGIAIEGRAEMGFAYGPSDSPTATASADLLTDIDALVTFRRELDNGLTIGFEFDLSDELGPRRP
jgi:hypothetical protein